MNRIPFAGLAMLLGGLVHLPAVDQVNADIEVRAVNGQPFGVGTITLTGPDQPDAAPDQSSEIRREAHLQALTQLGHEAFYPVIERTGVPSDTSKSIAWTVYFLFAS